MNQEHLAKFEANIERIVESAFANFFGKKLKAHDIALHLARAMEDSARTTDKDGAPRLVAPDAYSIRLHPQIYTYLTQRQPTLPQTLSQHLLLLATQTHYHLTNNPIIEFVSDPAIEKSQIQVVASHTDRPENSTVGMEGINIAPPVADKPVSANLLINNERSIQLQADVLNIGRYRDNDIVLEDPYVSRHHLQLRKRHGAYLLFDVHSQGGTFVNGVRVKEYQLQSGDVIQVGKSHIVYMEDNPQDETDLTQTDQLEP